MSIGKLEIEREALLSARLFNLSKLQSTIAYELYFSFSQHFWQRIHRNFITIGLSRGRWPT